MTLLPLGSSLVTKTCVVNLLVPVDCGCGMVFVGKFFEAVCPVTYALSAESTAMCKPTSALVPPRYEENNNVVPSDEILLTKASVSRSLLGLSVLVFRLV